VFTTVDYTKAQYRSAMEGLIEGAVLAVLVVLLFLRDIRATAISAVDSRSAPPGPTGTSPIITLCLGLSSSRAGGPRARRGGSAGVTPLAAGRRDPGRSGLAYCPESRPSSDIGPAGGRGAAASCAERRRWS